MSKEDKNRMNTYQADAAEEPEIEIDLMALLYCLLEKAKSIIAVALAGMIIAGVYSFVLAKPVYEATCKLYVVSNGDSAINLSDLQIGSYLTSDFLEVFETWEVREQVLQNLQLPYDYEELGNMLTVTNPSDTRILNVTISSNDPAEAARIANEYAAVASDYISETMAMDQPSVLSSALEPLKPVKPRKIYNMALGLLLGGVLMAGLVTVRFLLDGRIKSPEDIRKYTGMATLAIVPMNDEDMPYMRGRNARTEGKARD